MGLVDLFKSCMGVLSKYKISEVKERRKQNKIKKRNNQYNYGEDEPY